MGGRVARSVAASGEVVRDLGRALSRGQAGLSSVRSLIRVVVRDGSWRAFSAPDTGELVTYEEGAFLRFVGASPPHGLGTDAATLERLCGGDMEALAALEAATQRRQGGDRRSADFRASNGGFDSTPGRAGSGSRQQALRRLRVARPDLHARVVAGELSAHAAMVAAGYRARTVPVPLDPERAARTLARALSPEALASLARYLAQECARAGQQEAGENDPVAP